MQWTDQHDVLMIREIILFEPWIYCFGSVERGESWKRIAESLNQVQEVEFAVDGRAIRDHYKRLEKKFKQKTQNELDASGIAPDEETELDVGIRDIIEQFYDFDAKRVLDKTEKNKKVNQELAAAEEFRNKALETIGESTARKRNKNNEDEDSSDCGSSKRKKRNNGGETMAYLKEKSESEIELRKKELELRQLEAEERKNNNKQLYEFIQQQQRQTNALLQGQQQVNLVLLQVMQKFS